MLFLHNYRFGFFHERRSQHPFFVQNDSFQNSVSRVSASKPGHSQTLKKFFTYVDFQSHTSL